jgi:hypothetical protein
MQPQEVRRTSAATTRENVRERVDSDIEFLDGLPWYDYDVLFSIVPEN